MSHDSQALYDIVVRSRQEIQTAKTVAGMTQRPATACPAHDAMFGLSMAVASGLDASLAIAARNIEMCGSSINEMTHTEPVTLKQLITQNFRLALVCATIVLTPTLITAIAFGRLDDLKSFVQELRGSRDYRSANACLDY